MSDLDLRRRFFAEEIEAVGRVQTAALVDAFAAVPREQFLPPGPWTVLSDAGESFMLGASVRTRMTPDADPRRVYHNIAVAIDPRRQLFNGQPGSLAMWLDALELSRGARVLHVGAGLGYYTAVMAECVGPTGRVIALEVDEALAAAAGRNLARFPWVEMRCGNAAEPVDATFDAIFVNAGVTHPPDSWLDQLAAGGRMIVPLTATMLPMGATLSKGLMMMATKEPSGELSARALTVVAIYSAIGLRDESLNVPLGKALMGGPPQWQRISRLRRDAHEAAESCWFHGPTCCWSS